MREPEIEQPNEAFAWLVAKRGLSMKELSLATGVSVSLLSKLRLHAQYPRWDTAKVIASALGVEPCDLWDPAYCQRSPQYSGLIERQRSTTRLARPWLRLRSIAALKGSSLASIARQGRISPRRLHGALHLGGQCSECALVDRLVASAAIVLGMDDLEPRALGWRQENGFYVEAW